jgi:hypothetical protein
VIPHLKSTYKICNIHAILCKIHAKLEGARPYNSLVPCQEAGTWRGAGGEVAQTR